MEDLWNKFKKAESKGQFEGLSFEEHIDSALALNFISAAEAEQLTHYNAQRFDSMLTDIFDLELDQALDLDNPHRSQQNHAESTNNLQSDDKAHINSPSSATASNTHADAALKKAETQDSEINKEDKPEAFLRF
jgi:acyl-CoA dehydrogenase